MGRINQLIHNFQKLFCVWRKFKLLQSLSWKLFVFNLLKFEELISFDLVQIKTWYIYNGTFTVGISGSGTATTTGILWELRIKISSVIPLKIDIQQLMRSWFRNTYSKSCSLTNNTSLPCKVKHGNSLTPAAHNQKLVMIRARKRISLSA